MQPGLSREKRCVFACAVAVPILMAVCAGSATAQGTWQGPYNPIPQFPQWQHCCEIAHAIVLAKPGPGQGKVLLFRGNGERWLWDPAAPSSVVNEQLCDTEPPSDILFCSGHSADSDGNIVVVAGTRRTGTDPNVCELQPTWSYVFDPEVMCWSNNRPLLTPVMQPLNFGYWYPGTVRLDNGRVLTAGGGSSPLILPPPPWPSPFVPIPPCNDFPGYLFIDGWQVFDESLNAWVGSGPNTYHPGLPVGANGYSYSFCYYPLLFLIPSSPPYNDAEPTAHVFAASVTDNRAAQAAPAPHPRSGSALMNAAGGPWSVLMTEFASSPPPIGLPNKTARNHFYPNGVIRPIVLDNEGRPTGPVEVMVIGGTDFNLAEFNPTPATMLGGRYALKEVSQIAAPEQASPAWAANGTRFPNMINERIYANAVILPDGFLFAVGGSTYDHYPYAGGVPTANTYYERTAQPVFSPELLDLFASNPQWVPATAHLSPRLYHSLALLLPDASVLVAGGYRGTQPVDDTGNPTQPWLPAHFTWTLFAPGTTNPHSDIEIFDPPYMSAGARPQIVSLTGGGTTITYGSTFEVNMTLAGASIPSREIGSVSLIAPGSVTHHFGWDQRYVGLHFTPTVGFTDKLTVTAPINGAVAPPGWYMLFITTDGSISNNVKIPSVAMFVKVQ